MKINMLLLMRLVYCYMQICTEASKEVSWSHLLFKCIEVIGDPDFSVSGDTGDTSVRQILYLFNISLIISSYSHHYITFGHDTVGFGGI